MALRTVTRDVTRTRPIEGAPLNDRELAEFREIVAAAEFNWSDANDRRWLKSNILRSQWKSRQAWEDYNRIGEVHKAINRACRVGGYAKLRCVQVNPDGSDGKTIESGVAAEIVQRIYAPYGGVRGLVDRFFALMKVPGDSYLIRVRDGEGEDDFDGYHFLSSHEVDKANLETFADQERDDEGLTWITLPSGSLNGQPMTRPVEGRDMLGRVWLPGRQWVDEADSPLSALATECEVLWGLTESMKANIRNRFLLGGFMGFPTGIQNIRVPGLPQGSRTILDYVEMSMTRAVTKLDDPKARLPILIQAKAEDLQAIVNIDFNREIFETDLTLRAELIERILFGLDIHTQATKGNEDANHFTAWVQSDEEVRIAIQPDLDTMCWALTRFVLHKELERKGWSAQRILKHRIAWDLSESAARTNKQEDTRQAHDRGLASGNSVLRAAGLSVTDDRIPDWELIRLIGQKTQNPYLALVEEGTKLEDIDWGPDGPAALFAKVAKPGPNPDSGSEEEPSAGPGTREPGSPSEGERARTRRTTRTPSG